MAVCSVEFCALMNEMASRISSAREAVKTLNTQSRSSPPSFDTKDGISLLSLKCHALILYLNSSTILSARRVLGHSLTNRFPPCQTFSTLDRQSRGNAPGDLVDSMIETRIVLEKIQALETRMRYQIEKLVRLAHEPEKTTSNTNASDLDPLSFRPNPQNFIHGQQVVEREDSEDEVDESELPQQKAPEIGAVYRPPRIAPMPYFAPPSKSKSQLREGRLPVPTALSSLVSDPSLPYTESTSGLGGSASITSSSGRATYLKRLTEFEEENFSRLVMKKNEARRRARDEADLALGGSLSASGTGRRGRIAGGLEDEFGDILKTMKRGAHGAGGLMKGDGYEELRNHGKKATLLERSRKREAAVALGEDGDKPVAPRKKSRFELEMKNAKRKLLKK